MAGKVGYYDPDTARMVLAAVKQLQQNGFVLDRSKETDPRTKPTDYVYVKNTQGTDIPAYACMQSSGVTDYEGKTYISVRQPLDNNGSSGIYLFNGPSVIPTNKYGIAFPGPVVRGLSDIPSGPARPVVSSWTIESSVDGIFTAIGSDAIADGVSKVFLYRPPTVVQQVVTNLRVSGTNLQYKTREIYIFAHDDETDWTTWHTGAECDGA